MITVTKTFFPPIEEYQFQLKRIWQNQWLTNRGELVLELEGKLKSYLNVNNIIITNNGTIPLQIALKLFGGGGEIITTPFSYVATTASIVWENCTPVFVDIDVDHFTIDERLIEAAITDKTTAVLATHVFGNPCHVDAIERIAARHNLVVIYDAAHCFGVTYKNRSIFDYGDVSTCSFHATKLFHTGEGGAIFCKEPSVAHKMFYSHNFGHNGPEQFHGVGINGKISELQSAMGLAMLPHMEQIVEERKKVVDFYNKNLDFSKLRRIKTREGASENYSYYPIVCKSESLLLEIVARLDDIGVMPRRYFYPSLNTLDYVKSAPMPISEEIAKTILCLPLYVGLTEGELSSIVNCINSHL